jgi:hypothetical protein
LLVQYVLTSMPTFFLTMHKMKKWAISRIDRFRRSFLWRGAASWSGQWRTLPSQLADLSQAQEVGKTWFKRSGEIQSCSEAWLWHQWDTKERPWKKLLRVSDAKDRHLFFSSTTIQIGKGKTTPFWKSRWLQGRARLGTSLI